MTLRLRPRPDPCADETRARADLYPGGGSSLARFDFILQRALVYPYARDAGLDVPGRPTLDLTWADA